MNPFAGDLLDALFARPRLERARERAVLLGKLLDCPSPEAAAAEEEEEGSRGAVFSSWPPSGGGGGGVPKPGPRPVRHPNHPNKWVRDGPCAWCGLPPAREHTWRPGPDDTTLCNRCGLQYARDNRAGPARACASSKSEWPLEFAARAINAPQVSTEVRARCIDISEEALCLIARPGGPCSALRRADDAVIRKVGAIGLGISAVRLRTALGMGRSRDEEAALGAVARARNPARALRLLRALGPEAVAEVWVGCD